jgi:hypothetical protein
MNVHSRAVVVGDNAARYVPLQPTATGFLPAQRAGVEVSEQDDALIDEKRSVIDPPVAGTLLALTTSVALGASSVSALLAADRLTATLRGAGCSAEPKARTLEPRCTGGRCSLPVGGTAAIARAAAVAPAAKLNANPASNEMRVAETHPAIGQPSSYAVESAQQRHRDSGVVGPAEVCKLRRWLPSICTAEQLTNESRSPRRLAVRESSHASTSSQHQARRVTRARVRTREGPYDSWGCHDLSALFGAASERRRVQSHRGLAR